MFYDSKDNLILLTGRRKLRLHTGPAVCWLLALNIIRCMSSCAFQGDPGPPGATGKSGPAGPQGFRGSRGNPGATVMQHCRRLIYSPWRLILQCLQMLPACEAVCSLSFQGPAGLKGGEGLPGVAGIIVSQTSLNYISRPGLSLNSIIYWLLGHMKHGAVSMVISDRDHHTKSKSESCDLLISSHLYIWFYLRVRLERGAPLGQLVQSASQDGLVASAPLGRWGRKASQ